ncbi:hypothetical protein ACFWIJ_02295 [Streptomyces sp. NPDC127079]|uniref:hypothetical protein n=1 Tax=Streptomyces sp. NPDC127079 TaxID=3347132 RepID=UPI00365B33F2
MVPQLGTATDAGTQDPAAADAAVQPWLDALRGLIPMPPKYRRFAVDRASALALLGCRAVVLDRLVAAGIPHTGTGDAVLFDYYDLANIALYSGAVTSVPLAGQRMMIRYASAAPQTWTPPRGWDIEWKLSCRDTSCPGGQWRVVLPTPEVFGGRIDELDCDQESVTENGVLTVQNSPVVRLTGRVSTAGRHTPLKSAVARRLFDDTLGELLDGRHRFQWMHPRLRTDSAVAEEIRIMDCTVCALRMQRQALAEGLTVRTRRGRFMGVLDAEHSWLEVLDEDGVWKPLDPVIALLALRHKRAREDFVDFCAGSVPSRFLPWTVAAGEPLAEHRCPVGSGAWDNTFSGTAAKGNA